MTVVATFAISGFPVVFGDLLITGPTPTHDPAVSVPAVGRVEDFFGDSGWSITALQQKVTIIGASCALAWSGSWLGAKTAMAGLAEISKTEPLTCDSILRFFQLSLDLQQHPASFVGIVAEDKGIRQFHYGAKKFVSDSIGNVYFCGSGGDALPQFSEFFKSVDENVTGAINSAVRSIAGAISLGGILLQTELYGGESATTLLNMFGGGYEVGFFADGRMQKLDDLTYAFWMADISKNGTRLLPPQLLVKQKYVGEHLLVRGVKVEVDEKVLRMVDDQRHIIRPMVGMFGGIGEEEVSSLSLQSK